MGGRGRKLQDFLVDRKVARADRDALPLVVDSDDRIVWVVGQSVAEDFRVTSPREGRDTLESKAVRRRRLNSTLKSLLFWIVLIVRGGHDLELLRLGSSAGRAPISFTDFLQEVRDGQVQSVVDHRKRDHRQAEWRGRRRPPKFRTYAPTQYEGLANLLDEKGVQIDAKPETTSPWATLLYSWAPILLMIGFWIFIMRQMQSGGNKALSFGKSRAKLSSSSQKKVTFKDVSGVDEAKEELQEIIEFLKEPQKFQKLGGRIPKGVLLMGSPGHRQDAARARRRR